MFLFSIRLPSRRMNLWLCKYIPKQSHYIKVAQGGVSSSAYTIIHNFSPIWEWFFHVFGVKKISKIFFCKRHFMQLFSADARLFLKKFWDFFLPLKTWKNCSQKLLIIGPSAFFFSLANRPKTCPKHIFCSIKMSPCTTSI